MMAKEAPKFVRFKYSPRFVTNVVFSHAYQQSVAEYLAFLKNEGLSLIEVTEDLFETYKTDVFNAENNPFLAFDIIYIDSVKFGATKTSLFLVSLEQTVNQKQIIVFSTTEFHKVKLVHMKQKFIDPTTTKKQTILSPIIGPVVDFYHTSVKKIREYNKLLDEFDEYNRQKQEVKDAHKKSKKSKQFVARQTPPLKKNIVDIAFLFFFSIISILSSFFAFSNSRQNTYNSSIKSASIVLREDAKTDIFTAKRTNLTNYSDIKRQYNEEKNWTGDFVSVLTFKFQFRDKNSGEYFNPILLPDDALDNDNFLKFGFALLSDEKLSEDEGDTTKAIVSDTFVRQVFGLGNEASLEPYIGASFQAIYNFKDVNFVIENIITNTSKIDIDSYYPNPIFIFEKPSNLDDVSTTLTTFIRASEKAIKAYLSHFYDNYDAEDVHEFAYLNKEGVLVQETFELNNILYELSYRTESHIIEIAFVIMSLVLGYFAVSALIGLWKVHQFDFKKMALINAVPVGAILLIYIAFVIFKVVSAYSIASLALLNTYGTIFALVFILVVEIIIWHQPIYHFFNQLFRRKK